MEGHGVGRCGGKIDAGNQLRGGLAECIERLPVGLGPLRPLGAALARHLRHDVEDVLRHILFEPVAAEDQFPLAVERPDCRDPLSIGREPHVEHAARHGKERKDQVGIVADDPGGVAVDAIGPRQAVGAGHDDVVEARVTVDGRQAAAQRTRRDRRDVVNEPLGGQFGEFDAHVTAHGDHMIPLGREDRVEHPVLVGALIEHLFPGLDANRPQAVIGAAKRDQGAIGRP